MLQSNQFTLSCPSCYSPDHVAYRLRVLFPSLKDVWERVVDLGTPYGEAMRHCKACGLKFAATSGVELRRLEPTTRHNEALAMAFSPSAVGFYEARKRRALKDTLYV